jgi:acyl carrier protein
MKEIDLRLTKCFCTVFPNLDDASARQATQASMGADWDSLASITLIRVIEEEFGVEIDLFSLESLNSYEALKQHLLESGQQN